MKKTKILAISIIVTQIIGIQNSFAFDYSKIKTKKELCKVAFNAKLDPIDEGCLLGKGDQNLASNVKIKLKNKKITGKQLLKFLDKRIEKKYEKIGAKGTGMVRAKEMFYQKLLKVVGKKFESSNNKKTKDLMGALYLTLSAGRVNLAEEFSQASTNQVKQKLIKRYGTDKPVQTTFIRLPSGEVIEIKQSLLLHPTIKKILQDSNYQQPTEDEKFDLNTRYVGKISDLNKKKTYQMYHRDNTVVNKNTVHKVDKTSSNGKISEGFFSTGISPERIEEAQHAKARANHIEWMKLTPYERQIKMQYISPSYTSWNPDSEISFIIPSEKARYERIKKGPIKGKNDLIYKHIVDDYNIYAGLLLDGGLVNYNYDLVKQTGFYQVYVLPYYGDTDGTWKSGTSFGRASKDVLAYFGYEINTDPLSKDYLKLTYDASKNQFKKTHTIDYIKNVYK